MAKMVYKEFNGQVPHFLTHGSFSTFSESRLRDFVIAVYRVNQTVIVHAKRQMRLSKERMVRGRVWPRMLLKVHLALQ